jgi:hypothetical protein
MHTFAAPRALRRPLALALVALLVAILAPAGPASASASPGDFVSRINALRAASGINPLEVDGELTAAAQTCAQHMADTDTLAHSPDITSGITQSWLKVGENVGVGPDVATVMAAFVASPRHYANIMDPAFNRIGVGVADQGAHHYTCHRFMQTAGSKAPPPPAAAAGRNPSPKAGPSASPTGGSGASNDVTSPATPAPEAASPPAPTAVRPGSPPPANPGRVAATLAALRLLPA